MIEIPQPPLKGKKALRLLELPALGPGGRIGATGPNIAITQDLPYPSIAVLVTIIACLSAGAVLTRKRRR